jgi:F-type H+-transporting ATPase subunit gamma
MTRLAEIQGHMDSMNELLDIVTAMRSLAGMRVQEAQRALPGVRGYAQSMARAIGDALLLMDRPELPMASGPKALVLCMAEHGFVGGFNERLFDAAKAALEPGDQLFIVGSRGAALALEHGHEADWVHPMATRLGGATETVNSLTSELYNRIARGEISRLEVMFSRYHQGETAAIECHLLLPLDVASMAPEQPGQPPLHNLPPRALLEKLIAEYVVARLTEAAIESISSENAARFSAMESARDNVTKKLAHLQQSARQARQSEITAELLDLVTGAEALAGQNGLSF